MPAFERVEDVFMVESETVPLALSKPPSGPPSGTASPGGSGDFSKDSKMSSYGSTTSENDTATASHSSVIATTDQSKDPEQCPLLGGVLPPPGGWSRGGGGGVPPGLSAADILPFATDPFWCRVRTTVMAMFWVVMMVLLAIVAFIVVNDPTPCTPRTPSPVQPKQATFNVSLPIGALPVLQAVVASRY